MLIDDLASASFDSSYAPKYYKQYPTSARRKANRSNALTES